MPEHTDMALRGAQAATGALVGRVAALRRWTRYDWLWLGWLAMFLAIEVPALRDAKRGNTFSESWWWFIGIGERKAKHARALRIAALSFSAWLVVHLWTRRV